MVESGATLGNKGMIRNSVRKALGHINYLFNRMRGGVDLRGKIVLIDSDELLLVWERELREVRLQKEEDAWKSFEKEFGIGAPEVTTAFINWQEQLYAYIEQEKDRFLMARQGARKGLDRLVASGAVTAVVTKGAKPYTQKCFNLLGLSAGVSAIYSPAPGKRAKRFVDAAVDYGKNSSWKCQKDAVIVGHDLDKDMAWDLVPAKAPGNDGNAPVFIMFETLRFGQAVDDPLDALPEIINLLARKGSYHFLRGFKSIRTPEQAQTKHYRFQIALYQHPKMKDKARIPVIHKITRR